MQGIYQEDDRRCTRAMMHLGEAERDLTCIEVHLRGVMQLLPQVKVGEVEELISVIAEKIKEYEQQVFQLSRDGIPSSVMV